MGSETNATIGTVAELRCAPGFVATGIDALICEPPGWTPANSLGLCQKVHCTLFYTHLMNTHQCTENSNWEGSFWLKMWCLKKRRHNKATSLKIAVEVMCRIIIFRTLNDETLKEVNGRLVPPVFLICFWAVFSCEEPPRRIGLLYNQVSNGVTSLRQMLLGTLQMLAVDPPKQLGEADQVMVICAPACLPARHNSA